MVLPFVMGILIIIGMLVGNTLFQLIDQILKNNIPLGMVAKLVAYNIPTLIVLTLPVGMAISASFAVNRLARDSELTAIRMAGISLRRVFLPIILVGVFVSLLSFWLGDHVVPAAERAFAETQGEMFGYAIANSPNVVSDKVISFQDYGMYVRDAEPVNPKDPEVLTAHGITIFKSATGFNNYPAIITADSATYNHGLWQLKDAVLHTLDIHGFTSLEGRAKGGTLDIRIPLPNVDPQQSAGLAGTSDNLSMADLGQQIALLNRTGQDATKLEVDYQFKLALPALCLAFAFCAPPLAMKFARSGSYIGIFLSIVMVFVAWNTLLLSKALGVSGHLPPVAAAWAPDILFMVVGLILLARAE